MNLVSNGIKYNHPGGNVWVEISARGTDMCVRVRDDGCGIRKEDQTGSSNASPRDKRTQQKMGAAQGSACPSKHIAEYYNGHIELKASRGKAAVLR